MITQTTPVEHTATMTLYLSRDFERETDRDRVALDLWLDECQREGYVAAELPSIDVAEPDDVDDLQDLFETDLSSTIIVISGKVARP